MSEVETHTGPPEVDTGGDGEPEISVFLTFYDADGSEFSSNITATGCGDRVVADALVRTLRGVGSMCGPGLQVAIQKAMGELP